MNSVREPALYEKKYEVLDKVGEGSYGMVFMARNRVTGDTVALKKIVMNDGNQDGIPSTALREISAMKSLKSDHIIGLLEVITDPACIIMVMEYMDMDLKKYLDRMKPVGGIKKPQCISFLWQILNGINYCHTRKVLHRDLKPANLLINPKGILKVADFGLTRAIALPIKTYTHEIITIWYRPVEIMLGCRLYATGVDIWSIGCIFAEMWTSRPLFQGESEIDQLFRIFRILGTPNEETWPGLTSYPEWKTNFPQWKNQGLDIITDDADAADMLGQMVVLHPSSRISAHEALDSPLFDDVQMIAIPENYFI